MSLFIDPDPAQIEATAATGSPFIELHTGAYCEAYLEHGEGAESGRELQRILDAAAHAEKIGLECHAGHGLTYDTVAPVAAIDSLAELNIGHFLVGEAIFIGFEAAIRRMREAMDAARPNVERTA